MLSGVRRPHVKDQIGDDRSDVVAHLTALMSVGAQRSIVDEMSMTSGKVHDRLRLAIRTAARSHALTLPGVQLHAAACRLPSGRSLLLPGRTGAGKSTLAALLASRQQAAVVADDIIVLEENQARGAGVPISIRRTSPCWEIARSLWYADESNRLLVRPDDLGGSMTDQVSVDALVFPTFGDKFCREPLSPIAAFCRLSSMIMRPAGLPEMMALARFANSIPAVEARFTSVDEAITLVECTEAGIEASDQFAPQALTDHELANFSADVWGIRFGDDVALFNRANNEMVHLAGWPAGSRSALTNWSALAGGTRVSDRT